ncbi:hypothetical protein NIES2109_55590 (plasmid) [Nostoc sp. HK-01]|nr:hypothetical protein NIES2109_55590 [Nostoc sp. HK-01]
MKILRILFFVSLGYLLSTFLWIAQANAMPKTLGKFPVCEPSAVVRIPCPNSNGDCLLVGDNEIKESLFVYPIKSGNLEANVQTELSLEAAEISDIEAITRLGENQVLIFGSYSRNTKCEVKKKRQRFLQAQVLNQSIKSTSNAIQTDKINSETLFVPEVLKKNKMLQAVAGMIDETEKSANLAQADQQACQKANAFNVEGAVAVPWGSQAETWLGLRSPQASVEGKTWAILLKLKNLNQFQFEQVVLLDLEGRGIRELTKNGNLIWGIAGGPEDDKNNFVLWKLPIEKLKPNAKVHPEIVHDLPTSSEGLAISGNKAYILIDGDRGNSESSCQTPGKFIEISVALQ